MEIIKETYIFTLHAYIIITIFNLIADSNSH